MPESLLPELLELRLALLGGLLDLQGMELGGEVVAFGLQLLLLLLMLLVEGVLVYMLEKAVREIKEY